MRNVVYNRSDTTSSQSTGNISFNASSNTPCEGPADTRYCQGSGQTLELGQPLLKDCLTVRFLNIHMNDYFNMIEKSVILYINLFMYICLQKRFLERSLNKHPCVREAEDPAALPINST